MAVYDLTSEHRGPIAVDDLVFSAAAPRPLTAFSGRARSLVAPAQDLTVRFTLDGVVVPGMEATVRSDGTASIAVPTGGVAIPAGATLRGLANGSGGSGLFLSVECDDGTPATEVYDASSSATVESSAGAGGPLSGFLALRPFSSSSIRVVRPDGGTNPLLVLVTVTSPIGGQTVSHVVSTGDAVVRFPDPVVAYAGDLVRIDVYGQGASATSVSVTLAGTITTWDVQPGDPSPTTVTQTAALLLSSADGSIAGTTTMTPVPLAISPTVPSGRVGMNAEFGMLMTATVAGPLPASKQLVTAAFTVGGTQLTTGTVAAGRQTVSGVFVVSGPPPFDAAAVVGTASINGPAARMNNSAASNGTEVFVWGGDTGAASSFTDDIYAWNKTLDTWRTLTTTTANGWRNRGMFYDKTTDRVYILTMENTDKMRGYSAVNGASQFTSTVPTNANQGYGTAMGFDRVNRKVYLTEGFGTRAWVYSFAGGTWTALPNRPTTSGYSVPTVHKGKVYLLVRDNATQADFRLHVYDPVANSWSTITQSLPAALKGLPIGSGADHAYGNNGAGRLVFWINTGGAYIYEPETDEWQTLDYTPTRYVGGLAGDDNGVYLGMGGATSDNNEVSTVRPIRIPRREVLTVAAGETLTLAGGGKHAYHTLRVDGTLVVDSTNGLPVEIFCKKFEVGATGLVDGIGRGHQGSNANGAGPGGPVQRLNEGGTGASHAGLGGRAPDGYDAPPAVYGNGTDESVTVGSSGAAGSNTGTSGGASGEGGDGGAGLAVFASETITIHGTVNVSGTDGQNGDVSIGGRAGGGGSGGTVLLRGSDVAIYGSVRADGGAGGIRVGDADSTNDSGGGGGGGYVKIFHIGTLTTTGGTITAAGGFGPVPPDVPGGQTTSGAVGGTFTGPAISTHNVAVVTEDTAHGAATNNMTTLAALPRYKASLISEANADALVDPRGFDVVLMPRGYRGTARPHTDARTRWVELGVPAVIAPTDAGGTAPYSSSPATGVRVASLSDSDIDTVGHKSISITNNTHDITSGLALGALQLQDTNNFWYAGSSAGTYVGTRLADATTITGTNITPADHGIIAVEEGTNGLGGRPLPARVVIFGPVYQGQTTLNSAGRDLLQRCINWAGRIPPAVDPNATTSFAGATSRTAPDENTPGARATT